MILFVKSESDGESDEDDSSTSGVFEKFKALIIAIGFLLFGPPLAVKMGHHDRIGARRDRFHYEWKISRNGKDGKTTVNRLSRWISKASDIIRYIFSLVRDFCRNPNIIFCFLANFR